MNTHSQINISQEEIYIAQKRYIAQISNNRISNVMSCQMSLNPTLVKTKQFQSHYLMSIDKYCLS